VTLSEGNQWRTWYKAWPPHLAYSLEYPDVPACWILERNIGRFDESDAAYRAALPQAQKLARQCDIDILRSKLLAFLDRRGFSFEIARETVNRLSKELGEEGADIQ